MDHAEAYQSLAMRFADLQERHNQLLEEKVELRCQMMRIENDFAILSYKYNDLEFCYEQVMSRQTSPVNANSVCKFVFNDAAALKKHVEQCPLLATPKNPASIATPALIALPTEQNQQAAPEPINRRSASRIETQTIIRATPSLLCGKCGITFSSKSALEAHKRRSKQADFFCNFRNCNMRFDFKCALRKHRSSHKFVCRTKGCALVLKTNKMLKQHEQTHSNGIVECPGSAVAVMPPPEPIKPMPRYMRLRSSVDGNSSVAPFASRRECVAGSAQFACDQCQSVFRHACILKAHKRIHSQHPSSEPKAKSAAARKRYACIYSACKKTFARRDLLNSHMPMHAQFQMLVCQEPNCSRSFVYKTELLEHLESQHGIGPEKLGAAAPVVKNE